MVCRGIILGALGIMILTGSVLADSPGDTIGITWFDYQSHLSMGSRICYDYLGGLHFTWMNSYSPAGIPLVYYNFVDEFGNLVWPSGSPVYGYDREIYPTIGTMADGRSTIAYYNHASFEKIFIGIDALRGTGFFALLSVPGSELFYWPKLSVDSNDRIHLAAFGNELPGEGTTLWYYNAYNNTWNNFDTSDVIGCLLPASSRSDSKSSLVYAKIAQDENRYDILFIESLDGINWNWNNKINITGYQPDDTVRATGDIDGIYDNDGDLHIFWTSNLYRGQQVSDTTILYHWSQETGISTIHSDGGFSFPGIGNRNICRISAGVDEYNHIFAVWTHFYADDISAAGFSNGELYMSFSDDAGVTWSNAENLTNSPSPNCMAGECDSDHWSSLAEVVDEYLHIFYMNDKDAGAAVQMEGVETANPMLYLRYPNPLFTSIEENQPATPTMIALHRNYPNPFNSTTTIEYNLMGVSDVRIDIYNLMGQRLETLIDSEQSAGKHSITWNASGMASGIYFYKLIAGDKVFTKRMTLLK